MVFPQFIRRPFKLFQSPNGLEVFPPWSKYSFTCFLFHKKASFSSLTFEGIAWKNFRASVSLTMMPSGICKLIQFYFQRSRGHVLKASIVHHKSGLQFSARAEAPPLPREQHDKADHRHETLLYITRIAW